MWIKLTFLLSFFCLPLVGRSQWIRDNPRKGNVKGIWIGLSGGTEFLNNSNLNHWLINNGVKAYNSYDFLYGGKALVWPKKLVLGADIGGSILASPSQKTTYFNFLVGLPLKLGTLNIVPLIGIGTNGIVQRFNDTIPQVLYQAKLINGKLFKERLSIETQVMLFKMVGKFDSFSVTVGCHTYFWQGDWRYIGSNGKVIENGIPNPSTFSPFISILYGFGAWNIK